MYYPIQIPYMLNRVFLQNVRYIEETAEACNGFAICFWEMQPLSDCKLSVANIIVTDACIDLVVSFDEQIIGFAGMSKTAFNFELELPNRSFGVRMMPGAFHQLTGLPATAAMDTYLPVEAVFKNFDSTLFFSLSFEEARENFRKIFIDYTKDKEANSFTNLFNELSLKNPQTVSELCRLLNFSPRQCQRLFKLHYGITPKAALNIIRFHKCMVMLTSLNAKPADILTVTDYYDQPHFIKDFKRTIGITPLELLRTYRT